MSIEWGDVPAIATGVGVLLAAYQLRQARRALREGFERTFVDRYERIIGGIDLEVMLGQTKPDLEKSSTRRSFFDYFELCEEELYFRAFRRVSSSTWRDWWYGIRMHLQNEGFFEAFEAICKQANGETAADESLAPSKRFERLSKAVDDRNEVGLYEPEKATLKQRLW